MVYYRRNVVVLSITIFLAAASWNQVIPFLPLFLKDLGVKDNLLRWSGIVFAAQSAAAIIAFPFWGKIGDRYGRKPMIIRAGLCLAGIYFGMSICQQPWQLALCRFLNGALTGFVPGSITLIATNTPEKRAARYVASVQAASAAGLILGPALGEWLANAAGYRASMRVSGIAVLLSTLLVLWLVQEPNKVKPGEKTSLWQDFLLSLKSPVMTSIMFTVMVQAVFAAAISPVLVLHLKQLHIGMTGVVYCLPAVAFVITARAWTRLGENWGFEKIILVGLAGGAVGAVMLPLAHGMLSFSAIYFTAGIFLAAVSPATAAITCTRVDEGFRGRAYGMQMAASTVGSLFAPLVGSQIGQMWGISSIFIFTGTTLAVGSVIYWIMIRRVFDVGKAAV